MTAVCPRTTLTALFTAATVVACHAGSQASVRTAAQPDAGGPSSHTAPSQVIAAVRVPPYTAADEHFITGMIGHHAQAVLMAGWAPTHGASRTVQSLCERIVVGQRDEIAWMQQWLRDRGRPVPGADASHDMMPGMSRSMLMPGMLTSEQLMQLDSARGAEFDRLFLSFMIEHHQGALTMVKQLIDTPGAAREDNLFKFVSDINADQGIEIERMTGMLAGLPPAPAGQ
jgi:uncharacterized protein (DUF305 family)